MTILTGQQLFDVIIVGGGAAGLYAALSLPRHWRVALLTKDSLRISASDWAQGGIAAAIDPQDSPQAHLEDTLKAGAGLCEPRAVEQLVYQAPNCIAELVELGVAFDHRGSQLALTLEAAHSHRRVLHAADTTGRAIVTRLAEQVMQQPNIEVFPNAFVLDLWLTAAGCQGVSLAWQGEVTWLQAGAVVLATGGGAQVYSQTTNPAASTGDGVAIAWRGGAQVRDLEFFQFHPTALTKPGAPRFLISEAVRGEGAHLVDVQGRRFLFDYHPDGELAPRDVVSRAIFTHLQQHPTSPDHVWLDLRPIPATTLAHRFPNILQVCQRWGIDPRQELVPVSPAAHYWMGGITTNLSGETTIPGLYALGETASTGVHGANRLASNSLLECLVFAQAIGRLVPRPLDRVANHLDRNITIPEVQIRLQTIRRELPRLLWQSAGISRAQDSLEKAIAQVGRWRTEFAQDPTTQALASISPGTAVATDTPLRFWGETRNLLDIALLILKSASFRRESRGGHYRRDYPATDPAWQVHTSIVGEHWSPTPLGADTVSES